MGLDMYLTRNIYIGANYEHNNVKGKISLTKNDEPVEIDLKKVSSITEEVAYWRKANQIHKWFVDNVQKGVDDCGTYYVDSEKLKELLHIAEQAKKEKNKRAELLPTTSGFFFGSTSYDEYYEEDLDLTISQLKEALADDRGDFYYHSSW